MLNKNTQTTKSQNEVTTQNVFGITADFSPKLVLSQERHCPLGTKITVSQMEFYKKLYDKINCVIDDKFDWTNVLLAGGLITGLLDKHDNTTLSHAYDPKSYDNSDIDLFIYGDNKTVTNTIQRIYTYFKNKFVGFYAFAYKRSAIFTFLIPGKPVIQLIGNAPRCNINDPISILKSFDMTHCQVGFDGEKLIYTDKFYEAIKTKETEITTSSIHAYRLVKAYKRGYSIVKPPRDVYIKNYFHTYTKDLPENASSSTTTTKFPPNTDKYRYIANLQTDIHELLTNPIVLKNLEKNYVPPRFTVDLKTGFSVIDKEISKHYESAPDNNIDMIDVLQVDDITKYAFS